MSVTDPPRLAIYSAYFALTFAAWSLLASRQRLIRYCLAEPSEWPWIWCLLRLHLLALALVSVAVFFWRGYSFSRFTVAFFWAFHVPLTFAAALALRSWLRQSARGLVTWAVMVGDASRDSFRGVHSPLGGHIVMDWVPDVSAAVRLLNRSEPPSGASEVVAALPAGEWSRLGDVAKALNRLPMPASIAVEGLPVVDVVAAESLFVFSTGPKAARELDYVFAKRFLDIAVAAGGLLMLAPLMLFLALIIRLRSHGPVLICQERVGCGGKRFRLLKFRSLPASSLATSETQWSASATDPWGRFLRKTGLDELPQLINVLRGEMSLVGPRPERPLFVEQFRKQLPFYAARHRLHSGITGWAQVNGWRGDTSISRRVEHDLYYLHHWSLAFDLRILWMTLVNFARQLWEPAPDSEGSPHARSV